MSKISYREVARTKTIETELFGELFLVEVSESTKVTPSLLVRHIIDRISMVRYFQEENCLDIYETDETSNGVLSRVGSIKLSGLKAEVQEAILKLNKEQPLYTEDSEQIQKLLLLCLS